MSQIDEFTASRRHFLFAHFQVTGNSSLENLKSIPIKVGQEWRELKIKIEESSLVVPPIFCHYTDVAVDHLSEPDDEFNDEEVTKGMKQTPTR